MIFVYPQVLLLIVCVLLLAFFYKNKKFQKIQSVFSKEILAKLEFGTSKIFGKNIRFYFSMVALIFLIIALARPIITNSSEAKEVGYESFNLVVILDISKSMEAKDVFPNRLEFAKKSLSVLMEDMSEANIAVIAYANDAFLVSPFSNDFKSINFLISHLNTSSLATNGSQIISALTASTKIYQSTDDKKRAVLLISDGADGRDMDKISQNIKDNKFVLHVLNIGTKDGISLSDGIGGLLKDQDGNIVISKRDDSIAEISKNSGGVFLSLTSDMSKLSTLSREIKASSEKRDLKKNKYDGAIELFYYPLILSLLLLFFIFNSMKIFSLLVLILSQQNLEAGLLDFWNIQEANKSYKNKEYQKAEENFKKLDYDESIYDKANALYKQNKYKEALEEYKSIKSFDGDKEFNRLYNMGNSNAKLNKDDEAIKNYEKALEINKDDKDAKFNLELLKKKKEEKKPQDKSDNKKQDDKKKQDGDKKKDQEKKDSNKEKSQKDGSPDNKDKKDSDQKKEDSDNKNKNDSKEKNDAKESKADRSDKKMSEVEAKKWEKMMDKKEFTTKPYRLQKSENGGKNEVSW